MHKLLFRLAIAGCWLIAGVTAAQAQIDTTDTFDFDDIPVDDVRPPYLGVGGGYLGMLTFMKFDELNKINREFGVPDFSGQVFLNGGGGVTAIGVVANLRLGVFGAGGSVEQSVNTRLGVDSASYTRTLRFGLGLTAAQFDYAIPLFEGLTVFPGVMAGVGRYSLELTQTKATDPKYRDLVDEPSFGNAATTNFNRSTKLAATRFYYQPAVNFEYVPIQFLMIRAGVGYSGFLGESWEDQAGAEVTGVPAIKADGLTAQFGLFVGLFQR